jgi:hypothetical protein
VPKLDPPRTAHRARRQALRSRPSWSTARAAHLGVHVRGQSFAPAARGTRKSTSTEPAVRTTAWRTPGGIGWRSPAHRSR